MYKFTIISTTTVISWIAHINGVGGGRGWGGWAARGGLYFLTGLFGGSKSPRSIA